MPDGDPETRRSGAVDSPREPCVPAAAGETTSTEKSGRKPRPPDVRYLGFRTTAEGREYALQVAGGDRETRLFLMFISHESFASHQLKFQDAPGLCFSRLQRELVLDPDLLPGVRQVMGHEEFVEYRVAHEMPALIRKRRRQAP